jgi:hypothetical protein
MLLSVTELDVPDGARFHDHGNCDSHHIFEKSAHSADVTQLRYQLKPTT